MPVKRRLLIFGHHSPDVGDPVSIPGTGILTSVMLSEYNAKGYISLTDRITVLRILVCNALDKATGRIHGRSRPRGSSLTTFGVLFIEFFLIRIHGIIRKTECGGQVYASVGPI